MFLDGLHQHFDPSAHPYPILELLTDPLILLGREPPRATVDHFPGFVDSGKIDGATTSRSVRGKSIPVASRIPRPMLYLKGS